MGSAALPRTLLGWIWRYRWRYFAGLVALGVVDACDAALPIVIKWAIDDIVLLGGIIPLAIVCGGYLAVAGVQSVYRYWWRQYFIGASHQIEADVRAQVFRHLQDLGTDYFTRARTGDLMGRLTNDLAAARMFFGQGTLMFLDALIYFVLVPPAMVYLSLPLTLWILAPLPLVPFFVYWMSRAIRERSEAVQERFSDIAARCQEAFAGIRVLQSFAREREEMGRMEGLSKDYVRENMDLARYQSAFQPALGVVMQIGVVIILIVGGSEVIAGRISLGTFVAFQSFLGKMVWPMMAVGWTIGLYQRGGAGMDRLAEVLAAEPAIADGPATRRDLSAVRGEVSFRNVSFRYPGAPEEALSGVDLTLSPGRTVALTGPIGGGKSTLLALIARLLDATSGEILVDGVPIREIPLKVLRRSVGYVPQETFLFQASIGENIAFGRPTEAPDEIRRAAENAQIAEFIEGLPEAYGSRLGERGVNLSGGQKQRVAIARALVLDPPILLLDDCLSAVDAETEHAILGSLAGEIRKRASLIVSHRVSALQDADEICVLKEGRIVERGTHEELQRLGGVYAAMVERQRLIEELEAA